MPDAVFFLEEARLVYPDVTHLLTKPQLLALDMAPREPFCKGSENEEFLKITEAYFSTKLSCDVAKNELRSALLVPRTAGKPLDVAREESVVACLEMVRMMGGAGTSVWVVGLLKRGDRTTAAVKLKGRANFNMAVRAPCCLPKSCSFTPTKIRCICVRSLVYWLVLCQR